jgi:hypothetical protein
MLCMQQCIDLCDITPEEAQAIREYATLAEIVAIQADCARMKDTEAAVACLESGESPNCEMTDIRDQLLEEVWAAEDFDDLGRVVEHYRDYALGQSSDGSADAVPDGG